MLASVDPGGINGMKPVGIEVGYSLFNEYINPSRIQYHKIEIHVPFFWQFVCVCGGGGG